MFTAHLGKKKRRNFIGIFILPKNPSVSAFKSTSVKNEFYT